MCYFVCLCVYVWNNCAVEILWLVLNDLCAEELRDRLEFVFNPDVTPSGNRAPNINWLTKSCRLTVWFCPISYCLALWFQPIPYWLYKLHGLNISYTCEICGNFTYRGPKAFQRHFAVSTSPVGMTVIQFCSSLRSGHDPWAVTHYATFCPPHWN